MVCPSLWGREGLVSGDSAQAIQGWGWLQLHELILAVMTGTAPKQTRQLAVPGIGRW